MASAAPETRAGALAQSAMQALDINRHIDWDNLPHAYELLYSPPDQAVFFQHSPELWTKLKLFKLAHRRQDLQRKLESARAQYPLHAHIITIIEIEPRVFCPGVISLPRPAPDGRTCAID